MKRLLIGAVVLVASTQVLANPIVEALKENPWPVHTCVMDVNGKQVSTVTDDQQYQKYSLSVGFDNYDYDIDKTGNSFRLSVDTKSLTATGMIFEGIRVIQIYKGKCTK